MHANVLYINIYIYIVDKWEPWGPSIILKVRIYKYMHTYINRIYINLSDTQLKLVQPLAPLGTMDRNHPLNSSSMSTIFILYFYLNRTTITLFK